MVAVCINEKFNHIKITKHDNKLAAFFTIHTQSDNNRIRNRQTGSVYDEREVMAVINFVHSRIDAPIVNEHFARSICIVNAWKCFTG